MLPPKPHGYLGAYHLFLLFLSFLSFAQALGPDCSTLNGKNIKLITFDAFDALFDTPPGLQNSIADGINGFNTGGGSQLTTDIYNNWRDFYLGFAGRNQAQFQADGANPQPFPYVLSRGLQSVLSTRNSENVPAFPSLDNPTPPPQPAPTRSMYDDYPSDNPKFIAVVSAWGKLSPFSDTVSALQSLAAANYTLGLLSNGDSATLTALATLLSGVNITYVFSSDYDPNGSGSFAPNTAVYARVLSATGFSSDQVVHVAGKSSDASGARDGGLYSILVRDAPGSGAQPCASFPGANTLSSILPFLLPSPTPSPSGSPTSTPSGSPTFTPTPTSAPTAGSSASSTITGSFTPTPTSSPSSSSTSSLTLGASASTTSTGSPTSSLSLGASPSTTPTATPSPCPSPKPITITSTSSASLDGGSVAGIVIFVLIVVGAGGVLATSSVARAQAWRVWRKLRAYVSGSGVGGIDITDKRPVAPAEEVEFTNPAPPYKVSSSAAV